MFKISHDSFQMNHMPEYAIYLCAMPTRVTDIIEDTSPSLAASSYARCVEAAHGDTVTVQLVINLDSQDYHSLMKRLKHAPFQSDELGAAEQFVIEYEPDSYLARDRPKPLTPFANGRDMRTVDEIRQWESHDRRIVRLLEVIDAQRLEILKLQKHTCALPFVERTYASIPEELLLIGEDD